MKILLDTCISPRTRDELVAAGHEVAWAGDWPADPGEDEILEAARRDSCILITLDKDFGEMAVAFGREHAGIVRLVDIPVRKQAFRCMQALMHYGDDLRTGSSSSGATRASLGDASGSHASRPFACARSVHLSWSTWTAS